MGNTYPPPLNFNLGRLTNSIVLSQPCNVEGFQCYSTNAAQQWIFVFDANALPGNGTVPSFAFQIPATGPASAYFGSRGRVFQEGLVIANSTSGSTFTIGANDCTIDVQYDPTFQEDVT